MTTPQVPPLPTPEYMNNRRWIAEHIVELVATYSNQWIGVHRHRVLAAGPGLDDVTHEAERNAPPYDIAYQYIDDGTLIFAS